MSEVRTYDIPAMHQFVADVDKRIEFLAEMHDGARNSATTVRAGFRGRTGGSFEATHADWQRAAQDHLTELRAMRDRVSAAARNYEAAERANRQMLQDL
ncbi:WXG100 family type VII secretion target [Gordonia bronchialis]|jgi:WXG100 family type VII secretion target|uniref:WXG100 family type VII secretion target n=1 Tax=Gordonia bronchialis TaxID=2054 RepID=UPI002430F32C|nr:WXG100 family type VII secretion target [Gordonia bronchialis]